MCVCAVRSTVQAYEQQFLAEIDFSLTATESFTRPATEVCKFDITIAHIREATLLAGSPPPRHLASLFLL